MQVSKLVVIVQHVACNTTERTAYPFSFLLVRRPAFSVCAGLDLPRDFLQRHIIVGMKQSIQPHNVIPAREGIGTGKGGGKGEKGGKEEIGTVFEREMMEMVRQHCILLLLADRPILQRSWCGGVHPHPSYSYVEIVLPPSRLQSSTQPASNPHLHNFATSVLAATLVLTCVQHR